MHLSHEQIKNARELKQSYDINELSKARDILYSMSELEGEEYRHEIDTLNEAIWDIIADDVLD